MEQAKLDKDGFATVAGVVHVYHIDPKMGAFSHESDEFLSVGVGIPAYSYIDAPPPSKSGFAVCRKADSWEYIEDHRGVVLYSTQTQAIIEITALGPLPDDVTALQPATPFDRWSGEGWITDEAAKHQAEIDVAETEKKRLQVVANAAIATLADAVEFDIATDDERQRYDEWRRYRILLSRVDTTDAPNIQWPLQPSSVID